jgi:N-acetylated-alpha-linked acidic dipeptidase
LVYGDAATRKKTLGDKTFKLEPLGSGSDFTPFLQHLGITTLNIGYGGEGNGGQYHSIYDSYDYFTRFGDPGLVYGITLSQTTGRTMLRLANADVLPFDFTSFYKTINEYVTEIKTLLDNSRAETEMQNRFVKEKIYNLGNDPLKKLKIPVAKENVPFLNFSSIENALVQLKSASDTFQKLYSNATTLTPDKLKLVNAILYNAESKLVRPEGLPKRNWYKHQVYAPGYYTGYGVKTLPAIREGIEQRNWKEAQENVEIVSKVLQTYTENINSAIDILK